MPDRVPFAATLEVRDRCLCLHVQRAARALARHFDEALRPAGLTNEQFSLMMALNRPSPPRMGEVADLLGADRTTLSAAVKPLVRRGLVEVSVDPHDARARRLGLTDEGHAALLSALPIWTAAHATVETGLQNLARLREDLDRLAGREPGEPAPCMDLRPSS